MSSRSEFFARMNAVFTAASNRISTDVFPVTDERNLVSRMLRASLAVATFSFLETYMEGRVSELMPQISRTKISYTTMPERFQKLVTVKALQGIATRLAFEKEDPVRLAEKELGVFRQFGRKRKAYSAMGFSPSGSNISVGQVGEFLKDLGTGRGWPLLSEIVTMISYSPLKFEEDFARLASARHSCAHNPSFIIPSGDLEDLAKTAIRIGVSFDLALTHTTKCYLVSPTLEALSIALTASFPEICIVEYGASGDWIVSLGGASVGTSDRLEVAERLAKRTSHLAIVRNGSLIPVKIL